MGMIPDTYADMAAFASHRDYPWWGLESATVFHDEPTTDEMLRRAWLADWDVRVVPQPAEPDWRITREEFAVIRTNPWDQGIDKLGTVGSRYTVFQNEQVLAFGEQLLGEAAWETAGSMDDGRIVFATLALEREIVLDPDGVSDKVTNFLSLATSHDGSSALQAMVTPVRIVCKNTLDLAMRQARQRIKIRHTAAIENKVETARAVLGLADKYLDAFEQEAAALYAASVTDQQFWDIINLAYPKPEGKAPVTRWQNKVDLIQAIYGSKTTHMLKGTKWGALNAMTERLDWFRQIRNGNVENALQAAAGFDAVTTAEKNRLHALVAAF